YFSKNQVITCPFTSVSRYTLQLLTSGLPLLPTSGSPNQRLPREKMRSRQRWVNLSLPWLWTQNHSTIEPMGSPSVCLTRGCRWGCSYRCASRKLSSKSLLPGGPTAGMQSELADRLSAFLPVSSRGDTRGKPD